ncbi:sulfur oxidation c-type cytochrome SoxA [Sulfurimonas sp. SAG-AH-194-C20]|nr:sulfur oxidation c-type cytochrome SoxA [Sulfurimonas sp. SAG-AH-194-C20]MDF1879412.1 sulfur oxidation c-type cytochrome SoxA [Sulfurimonas sp. SAG-AH-194-C20]
MKLIAIIFLILIFTVVGFIGYKTNYFESFLTQNKKEIKKKIYINTQFFMTDADRALYAELRENNPADMILVSGEEYLANAGGDFAFANFINVSTKNLPHYIAGFPRYIKKFNMVVSLDQAIQAFMYIKHKEKIKLESPKMFALLTYVKSIANGEKININIKKDVELYEAYTLGKKTFHQKRGGRGLSCLSCHSKDILGSVLRTQPLPDLSAKGVAPAASWPAYRMTKSSTRTLQRRFQGCMKNSLMTVIPLGSAEMVALEVYLTKKAIGAEIYIPGIKR